MSSVRVARELVVSSSDAFDNDSGSHVAKLNCAAPEESGDESDTKPFQL